MSLTTDHPQLAAVLCLHRRKELGVRLGLAKAFENDFHLLDRRKRIEHATHYPDAVKIFLADAAILPFACPTAAGRSPGTGVCLRGGGQ
jgi:hypothetical protein